MISIDASAHEQKTPGSHGVQGVAGSNPAVPITYEVAVLLLATGVLFRSRASHLA
jgi:hypothetical protein